MAGEGPRPALASCPGRCPLRVGGGGVGDHQRAQNDGERGPHAKLRRHRDFPAKELSQIFDDGEPKPCSAPLPGGVLWYEARGFGLEEGAEYLPHHVGRQAHPGVADLQDQVRPVQPRRLEGRLPAHQVAVTGLPPWAGEGRNLDRDKALLRELHRVPHEVVHNLLQPVGVSEHQAGNLGPHLNVQFQSLF